MRRKKSMKAMMNKILRVLAVFFFCLTTFTAGAADLKSDLTIYYDVTDFGDFSGKKLQLMVGHGTYSITYEMKKVEGYDNLYSVNIGEANGGSWNGASELGFMAADGIWGEEGNGASSRPKNRIKWAPIYTGIYSVSTTLSGNVLFTGKSTLSITKNYQLPVKYYIAGNGTANNPWCNSNGWSPNFAANELIDGVIKFNSVPAGNYEFKVTKGSWDSPWGSGAIDYNTSTKNDCRFSNLGGDDDQNIVFTTTETANITISFNGSKVSITAEFSTPAKENSYVLMGVDGDWETGIPLELNKENKSSEEYMLLGQEISRATDAVKVVEVDACGTKLNYYSLVKTSTLVPYGTDKDGNIVLENGIYDFYFDKDSEEIYIGGKINNPKTIHLDPNVYKENNAGTWTSDDARIVLYYFKGDIDGWVNATKCSGIYYAQIPEEYDGYLWARMNPDYKTNQWNNDSEKNRVWNQTSSIEYDAENTLTKITGWDEENHTQTKYTGICGKDIELDCQFAPIEGETVSVTIDQFSEPDYCNYKFNSFEEAFAVLKLNPEICTATSVIYGQLEEDEITLNKNIVMQVVFGPQPYKGTESVGMSGGNVANAPAIFFRNIKSKEGKNYSLVVRTADPKGNRAVLIHPVIRRSKNIVLDNLDIISDPDLRDNALDIDTGKGGGTLEYTDEKDKDFNLVALPAEESNITIKNCFIESFGRNGIHVVGIKGLHVENNEFFTKYDFTGPQSEEEKHDVVDWGGTIKFINCTDVKFLRNNSEGTLATSFFIQGCQRMLIMNNVFWNDNKVEVPGLTDTDRTVANVRLVNYATKAEDANKFPLKNIGIYYNTFFIRSNDSESATNSYTTFDFFRLGGLRQLVTDANKANFEPATIRFQYNNCYSYDKDIAGNNKNDSNEITFYLQGIGKNTDWCQCFKYNNFWSVYDESIPDKQYDYSDFEIGRFCEDASIETNNAYINVQDQVCKTKPNEPGALVVKGSGLNIGTVVIDDVSGLGANEIFTDRLHGDTENPIRPTIVVDNSNESLAPYDHIYKEPGTIHFYTSPIVATQTTDVHVSSISLDANRKVNLSIVNEEGDLIKEPFSLRDADIEGKLSLQADSKGSLDNKEIFVSFKRPNNQDKDAEFKAFLKIQPADGVDAQLELFIPLKGHNTVIIKEIPGAWTVGAFQQRQSQPVNTIIWHGTASSKWDDRNNWYKEDGTLVTCLDDLTEDLTVIIPNKDSKRYVTPPEGITNYPKLPNISSESAFRDDRTRDHNGEQVNAGSNTSAKTTKVAHKIYMEYGAALLGVEGLASGGVDRYSEVEMEFTARRHDWLLVGPVVKPWGENGTRNVRSGDYFLNDLPHVYMHRAEIKENQAIWNNSFTELDSVVTHQKVFAIRLPDQYGRNLNYMGIKLQKLPADVYNELFPGDALYDGNAPHTYRFTGRFYNEKDFTEYTGLDDFEKGEPILLNNTYPANLIAGKLAENVGTVQIYDYSKKSFREAEADELIMSQHGFVVTPKDKISSFKISSEYLSNSETGHKSASIELPELSLQLSNKIASTASVVTIRYDELKVDEIDYAVDAPKIFNTMEASVPELYVMRYGKKWTGVNIPTLSEPIPLGISVGKADQTFRFSLQNSSTDFDVILEDRQRGKQYNLSEGEVCMVENLPIGLCEGRFYLNLSEKATEENAEGDDVTTEVEESDLGNAEIDIYSNGNMVIVSSTSDVELQTILITDISGRHQVYNVSGQYVTIDLPVSTGVYTISVIGDKATRIEKLKLN